MWGGGHGMFGGLMMILFWGIVIALIVFAVKWFPTIGDQAATGAMRSTSFAKDSPRAKSTRKSLIAAARRWKNDVLLYRPSRVGKREGRR